MCKLDRKGRLVRYLTTGKLTLSRSDIWSSVTGPCRPYTHPSTGLYINHWSRKWANVWFCKVCSNMLVVLHCNLFLQFEG